MPKNNGSGAVTAQCAPGCADGKRVAVVRLSSLGDVAMVLPMLYAACGRYPRTRFVLVTKKAFARLCAVRPDNLEVLAAETGPGGRHAGLRGLLRLERDMAADVLVDLHDVLRTRILRTRARLRGKPVFVFDKARAAKRRLVNAGAADSGTVKDPAVSPTPLRYALALAAAGFPVGGPVAVPTDPGVLDGTPSPAGGCTRVQPYIQPTPDLPLSIGLAPFAAHATKAYPWPLMQRTVRQLAALPGVRLFLFGAPAEAAQLDELCREADAANPDAADAPAVNVASLRLGFAGEMALMARLNVMVSMDSGNMHLAAAVGTDTVSIWGPTHPAAGFGPTVCAPGQRHIILGDDSCACRPCSVFGNKPCRIAVADGIPCCMLAITPRAVTDAVASILKIKPL